MVGVSALLLLTIAQESALTVQERVPIAVVVNTPTGLASRASRSELIRILDNLLKRHTDFFPEMVDETVVEECQGNLACVTLRARRDYKRDALLGVSGKPLPFEEHDRRLKERSIVVPRKLIMVSNVSAADRGDRLSILLLDIDRALKIHHETPRGVGYADEIEIAISEQAIISAPPPSTVMDEAEAMTILARVFDRDFASALGKSGHWEPYGTIAVELDVAGVTIDVDESAAGISEHKRARISGVRPGERTLVLSRTGYETTRHPVRVEASSVASVALSMAPAAGDNAFGFRPLALWSGVAVAALGVAITGFGIARHDGSATSHCFDTDANCSQTSSFESFGYDPTRSERSDTINPGGVLVAPLGYSLVVTGATWSLGTLFFSDADEIPWLPLALGVVLGGLSYGLSAAL